jgi:hypothetical protein
MKAKLFWLILSLGALLLGSCSLAMAPPPGDYNITARLSPMEYVVNGTERPEITLTKGMTYTFSVNARNHPFIITQDPNGGPTAPMNVAGVTGQDVDIGTITFTPDAVGDVYYQCHVHTGMGNVIHVIN